MKRILLHAVVVLTLSHSAFAQQAPQPDAKAAGQPAVAASPPAAKPSPVAAKVLFGAVKTPAEMPPAAVGFYSKGCLAGAQQLPINGPAWQVMRLSRNRNWGHPSLVAFIERFAKDARTQEGWSGLLVGDMSQPRGGPMASGHASHQVGLDTDLWYIPAPATPLTRDEREKLSASSVVNEDKVSVNTALWTPGHARLVKRAASYAEVERIFVNPAIKKSLCETATSTGADRSWLAKVRPYWGHDDHFHIRIVCPADSPGCKPQAAPAADDGCGTELTYWLKIMASPPKPDTKPQAAPPPLTLDALPAECRVVLNNGKVKAEPAAPSPAPIPGK
jgi:penicillin-insensitive murein endopeptidase